MSLFESESATSRMLASSIFGLKTDMASMDVLAPAKNAVDMRGMSSVKSPRNRKHSDCEGRSHIIQACRCGSAGRLRLANLKLTRTFVRVVYHHSRMAMRSHLGGRDRHEALSGEWKEYVDSESEDVTRSRGSQAFFCPRTENDMYSYSGTCTFYGLLMRPD